MTASEIDSHRGLTAAGRDKGEHIARTWLVAAAITVTLTLILTVMFLDGPIAYAVAAWPPSLTGKVATVTGFAGGSYLLLIAFGVTLLSFIAFLAMSGRMRDLLREISLGGGFIIVATITALACASILKVLIGRARPELLMINGPHAFFPLTTARSLTSFPSGEASMALAFFGACALMARQRLGRWGAMCLLLPGILVAVSRPIIGAHYVSDVLAAAVLVALVLFWLNGIWERHHGYLSVRLATLWNKVHFRAASRQLSPMA
jgi:membrane-associated phospholipid phosphatase